MSKCINLLSGYALRDNYLMDFDYIFNHMKSEEQKKMKDLKMKLIVGASGIITIGALGGAIAFGNVNAANHGNYKNQTKTQSILEDVSDLTTNELGILEVDANGDGVTDIYSDFGSFKTAMELTAEQVDANTENIAAESDIYSSANTYSVGDLCIKDGEIYSCTSEITSGEDWDESHWEKASVTTAVNTINDSLSGNSLIYQDGNFYIENRGADTGLKKLGSISNITLLKCVTAQWKDISVSYTTETDCVLLILAQATSGDRSTDSGFNYSISGGNAICAIPNTRLSVSDSSNVGFYVGGALVQLNAGDSVTVHCLDGAGSYEVHSAEIFLLQ